MPQPHFDPASFDGDGWAAAIAPFRDLALPQCWAYGAARAEDRGWTVERGLVVDGARVIGAAQAMVRALPVVGGGLVWIGRGPMWRQQGDDADPARLVAVLAALRRHYVAGRGFYLRIGPAVAGGDAVAAAFAAAGFRDTGTAGWASAVLDLGPGPAVLRGGLAQKWRNALNKAERLAIAVERGADDAALAAFLDEYRGFLAARGFATTVTPALLGRLQRHLPAGRKLVCYRASQNGMSLGSALIVRYGRTAEYLAGTLLDAGRPFNVGQLLLWRAVCDAREGGLERFDVGGMDPVFTPRGIYDFKNGLGGAPYRCAPEIEADDGGMRASLVRWRVARARAALGAGSGPGAGAGTGG